MSVRKFGVEIEAVGLHYEVAAWGLRRIAGFEAGTEDDGSIKTYKNWFIDEDSLTGSDPFEAVSPILRGDDGLKKVRKAATVLRKMGAVTNRSCGLHVHVSAKGLTPKALHTIAKRYHKWEPEIDSWMPKSRRKSHNQYCKGMKPIVDWIDDDIAYDLAAGNKPQIYESRMSFAMHSSCSHDRKVDFEALDRYDTIEFRHHPGTLDPWAITNWIKFCVNFVEVSADLTPGTHRKTKKYHDTGPLMGLSWRTKRHFKRLEQGNK